MTNHHETSKKHHSQRAPGEIRDTVKQSVCLYLLGLSLAGIMTAMSFWVATTDQIWAPSVVIWLGVLAIAQIGVHLVFFLHLSTGRNNSDNLMAVLFGLLIIFLFGGGTIWIMANLNSNMDMNMPMMDSPKTLKSQ